MEKTPNQEKIPNIKVGAVSQVINGKKETVISLDHTLKKENERDTKTYITVSQARQLMVDLEIILNLR